MMPAPSLPVLFAMIALGTVSTLWPGPKASDNQWTRSDENRDQFNRAWPKHTFEERWWPGEGLPLKQPSPYSDYPMIRVVKTVRITQAPPEPPQEVVNAVHVETAAVTPEPPRPAIRLQRPKPVRVANAGICARHGMHKVMVGRYKWRCRR